MKLRELLTPERIQLRPPVGSVEEALALLVPGSEPPGVIRFEAVEGPPSPGDRSSGAAGLRISRSTLIVHHRSTRTSGPRAALAVSPGPLPLSREKRGQEKQDQHDPGPRIVVLLQTSPSEGMHETSLGRLSRTLRDPQIENQLLSARSAGDVLGILKLMEVRMNDPMRVEDVLVPLPYRVFPDTPLTEVVDLMARKGLQALPVVGEDLRVLGVVTAGEALKHALQRMGRGTEEAAQRPMGTARDAMNRTVMCVSEDQDLLDAAQLMANKGVAQLPVIRDGGIVGILTRDAVLGALFGGR